MPMLPRSVKACKPKRTSAARPVGSIQDTWLAFRPRCCLAHHPKFEAPDQSRPARLGLADRGGNFLLRRRVRSKHHDAADDRRDRRDHGRELEVHDPDDNGERPNDADGDGNPRGKDELAAAFQALAQLVDSRFKARDRFVRLAILKMDIQRRLTLEFGWASACTWALARCHHNTLMASSSTSAGM